jgi:eukaryotic-like serine/threonine-protein kinase
VKTCEYSRGRFGFRVQKKIWLECGGKVDYDTECKLGDRVGWLRWVSFCQYQANWLRDSDLTYNLQAPVGHLPWLWSNDVLGGRDWAASSLASRAVSCSL